MKRVALSFMMLFLVGLFTTGAIAQTKADVIKIGALLPLSGGAATWGIPSLRSLELMTDKINAEGVKVKGVKYRMDLVRADTKSSFDAALAQTNKLIFEDKVKFINGPIISGEVLAILPVTEANKVIVMPYAASPKVIGPGKFYSFRLYPSVRESMLGFYSYLHKQRPDVKTIGLIGPNDESGWDNSTLAKELVKDFGLQVTFEDFVQRATTDFFPVLTKLVAKNPHAVLFHATPGGMTALLLQQSNQLGYKGLVMIPSHQDPSLLIEKAGVAAAEGCILTTPNFATGTTGMQEVYKNYQDRYKEKFDPIVNVGYPMLGFLKLAIEKANSLDTTEVAKAMESLEGEMIYGHFSMGGSVTYGAKRQVIYPIAISQIKGGQLVNVSFVMPPVP
jgi:branched-chain amino acid transport system substrate-binding protein